MTLALLVIASAPGCRCSRRSAAVPVLPATYVRQLLGPPTSEADALAFSPDGTLLAVTYTAGYYGSGPPRSWVTFYRLPGGVEVRPAIAFRGTVLTVEFAPDGRYAILGVAGDATGSMIFSMDHGSVRGPAPLGRGSDRAIAFSPDGATVAVTRRISMLPELLLFAAPDGALVHDFSGLLRELQPTAYETPSGREAVDVALSPDGALMAFTRSDGARGLARVADGTLVRSLGGRDHGQGEAIAFSPDGRRVASTNTRTLLQVWNTSDGRLRFTVPMAGASESGGSAIAFDPRADRVFVLGPGSTVMALSGATGAVLGALGAVPSSAAPPPGAQPDLAHGASHMALSRDGRWIAFSEGLRGARLFSLR